MNYLAIDASTEACSVALQVNDEIFSRYELCPQSHSLQLLPMVDQVLTEAGIELAQLDGLIYGQGPGSFTGVRIGVGVAQGLAFASNLSVVGVSTLQAMAQAAFEQHKQTKVVAAIDARMHEVYNGYFELDENNIMQAKQAESVIPPAQLADHLAKAVGAAIVEKSLYGVGSGWDAYESDLSALKSNHGTPDILFPDAKTMLIIGKCAFAAGKGMSAEQAQPVYVRDTVSWKKLPGRE